MRVKYYLKLFGQTYIRRSFAFFLIILILAVIMGIVMLKRITPSIKVACESRAKSVALGITNETVKEILKEAEHESLVNLTYNTEGGITKCNSLKRWLKKWAFLQKNIQLIYLAF